MDRKIILFDIDYTLFDTAAFRERLYKSISTALGFNLDEFSESLQKIYDEVTAEKGFFEPKVFSLELAKKLGRDKDRVIIEKAIFAKDNFKNGLYQESLGVIERLSQLGIVGIFSRGYNSFQKKKIHALKHLLDKNHIHILVDKHKSLPEILKKYKNNELYLVDDALDILHIAWKLRKDIITIWVKRGRYAQKQKPIPGFKPDAIVNDLSKLKQLITNN